MLWTNSSPTSSFTEQSVTLSESISEYEYIKFSFYNYTGNSDISSIIISVDDLTAANGSSTDYEFSRFTGAAVSYGNKRYIRPFYYESDTSIYFNQTTGLGTSIMNNALTVPYQVIGLK